MQSFTVHSPARVCLFGDHQDYLGLPVIAGTIDRFMSFEVSPTTTMSFEFDLSDLGQNLEILIDPSNAYAQGQKIDFLRAGLRVAARYGFIAKHGLRIRISSEIPINAGISSSSALVVGWLYALALAFGNGAVPSKDLLGQMAFEAEVIEHQSPGGQMDQYTIAHGGLVHIKTGTSIKVTPLALPEMSLVLADSKIKKQTLSTIGSVREFATQAFEQIHQIDPNFSLADARIEEINKTINHVSPHLRHYATAAVRNHEITLAALEELKSESPNIVALGRLMSAHHHELSQVLNVSHQNIDQWMQIGLNNGAYGGKIVGSGHGGCSVFLVPKEQQNSLCKELLTAGVPAAYPVKIDQGCHHITS